MSQIGIDARLWGTGNTGIGRYIEELVKQLQLLDTQNQYVLFCRRKDLEAIPSVPGWKKVVADVPHYSFSEQINLVQIFLQENLDLLHTPHFNVPILYPRPFIITLHDILWHKSKGTHVTNLPSPLYWGKYAAYRVAVKTAVARAKRIIVPSHTVERDVIRFFPQAKQKLVVTYEGVPQKSSDISVRPKDTVKQATEAPYVLYVGNLYPHKNVERLVQSIKQMPTTLVVVCGRSIFQDKFRSFLEKEKVSNVVVLGHVSDSELTLLYKHAEAFVFPTLSEGFGLPGLEAMQSDCPVVCSAIPVLEEVYGDAALYFDPNDTRDMTEKIKEIVENKKLRQRLVNHGKKQVKKYSWRAMGQKTLAVYQEVLR